MILPAPLEGWQASIWCGGKQLDEYQVVTVAATKTEPTTMRCFVEATEGAVFKLVTDPPADSTLITHDVAVWCRVDGAYLDAQCHQRSRHGQRQEIDEAYLKCGGGTAKAPLKFAPLILTDVGGTVDEKEFAELGSIRFDMTLGKAGEISLSKCPILQLSGEDVPEKLKKTLVDQRVTTGITSTTSDSRYTCRFEKSDSVKDAIKVVFMYRSKRTLQAMGVLPRDPGDEATPDPHDADNSAGGARDAEDGPRLEGAAAKKRILALEAENARLRKRMRRGRADDDDAEVGSCEASAIDLTED